MITVVRRIGAGWGVSGTPVAFWVGVLHVTNNPKDLSTPEGTALLAVFGDGWPDEALGAWPDRERDPSPRRVLRRLVREQMRALLLLARGADGRAIELVRAARAWGHRPLVIVLAAGHTVSVEREFRRAGADGYFAMRGPEEARVLLREVAANVAAGHSLAQSDGGREGAPVVTDPIARRRDPTQRPSCSCDRRARRRPLLG